MGELASIGAAFFWAAASLLFATLGRSIRPTALNFLKCSIALVLMAVTWLIVGPSGSTPSSPQLGYLVVSGLIGLTIGDSAYFAALTRLGPRKTLLFSALTPFVTALMGSIFLSEDITAVMLVGMVLTVSGVLWVVLDRSGTATPAVALKSGAAFAALALSCQAGGSILTKLGTGELSSLEVSIVRLLAGSIGLIFVVSARTQWRDVASAFESRRQFLTLLVALFFGTYLGVWLMNTGLKYTYAGIAATLNSTSPIWILPMAHVFAGDRVTPRSLVGALLAVAGVAILFLR